MDWKARVKNKTFWVALLSAIILLIQQIGLSKWLPNNIGDIVNTILLILTILGVIVDPTTSGIRDGETVPLNVPNKPIEEEDKK